jgi:hypothetical protein
MCIFETDKEEVPSEWELVSRWHLSLCPPQFCGPFEILDRMGPIAYRVALPSTVKAHNVFHVSLLKKYVHDSNHIID